MKFIEDYLRLIGILADTLERILKVLQVLETWNDIFVTDVREMPVTDLIEHRIPTYDESVPKSLALSCQGVEIACSRILGGF